MSRTPVFTTPKPWLNQRQSGVLCHVSSLPGRFGIGNFGASAHRLIDWLAASGFHYWQICPLGPTGYGDSPYQSFSSYAGNPYFIDLAELASQGLLHPEELQPLEHLPPGRVDYGGLYRHFWPLLRLAADRFDPTHTEDGKVDWEAFQAAQSTWLESYAFFMALKAHHGGRAWTEWAEPYRDFHRLDPASLPEEVQAEARRRRIYQYWFFDQWQRLRTYAHERGVEIIGDVPIFVAHDSADVWSAPENFRLHADGRLQVSAGVPPDYYSELGQFWGNPLYDWAYLRETGYRWWLDRLAGAFALYDVVRLDHFRGFSTYWEIPGDAPDARTGQWQPGPGLDFFQAVYERFPAARIIAEDLGYIDREVFELREATGLPGMKVLQFGFGHDANQVNLPHHYPAHSVVYTGTHDNDTTVGWRASLQGGQEAAVQTYFDWGDPSTAWPLVRAALLSVSRLAVVPLQDLLDLGPEARMNLPGTQGGNWQWRCTDAQLDTLYAREAELRRWNHLSGRTADSLQHDFSAPPEDPAALHA
ncbi:MAG: 4-alpha-glucanotransferase [Verrucomicrobiota bacterium JB022]|nr:4-alpha-glucanotransferase [Verrucomicrobiota bacterium JB022]